MNYCKNNKSGHKYITYDRTVIRWRFIRRVDGKQYQKSFKSKTDAICYKFIFTLRLKQILAPH